MSLTPGGPYSWTSIAPSTAVDLELSNGVTRYFVGRVTDSVGNVSAVSAEQAATPNFPAHFIVNRRPTPNDLFGFTRHAVLTNADRRQGVSTFNAA